MGVWMAASSAVFMDDQRLCAPSCHPHAVAVHERQQHVGRGIRELVSAQSNPLCACDAGWPPPYWPATVGQQYHAALLK